MSDTVYPEKVTPAPAPESCFVWDGTVITNLTPEGETYLTEHNGVIGIPDKCTSITGGFQGREGVTVCYTAFHRISTPDLFYKPLKSTKIATSTVYSLYQASPEDPRLADPNYYYDIYCDEYWGKNPRIEFRLELHINQQTFSNIAIVESPLVKFPYDGSLQEIKFKEYTSSLPPNYGDRTSDPFQFSIICRDDNGDYVNTRSYSAQGTFESRNTRISNEYGNNPDGTMSLSCNLASNFILLSVPLSEITTDKGNYTVHLSTASSGVDYIQTFRLELVGTEFSITSAEDYSSYPSKSDSLLQSVPTIIHINSPRTTSYITEFYDTSTDSFKFADVRSGGLTLAGGQLLGVPIVISELHSAGRVLDSQGASYGGDVPLFADCIGHLEIYESSGLAWYANGPLSEGTFTGLTQEDDGNWYVSSPDPCIIPPELYPVNFSVSYKNSYEGWSDSDHNIESGGLYYFTRLYSKSWTPLRYYEGWREVGQVPENIVPEGRPFKLLGSFTSELYSPEGEHSAYKYRKYYLDEFLKRLLTSTVEFEAVSESDSVKIIPSQDSRYVSFAPVNQEDRKSTSDDRYYSLTYGSSLNNLKITPELSPPMLVRDLYEHRNFYILESPGYRLDDTGGSFIARIAVRLPNYEDASAAQVPGNWFYRYSGNVGPAIAGLFRYIVDVDGTPKTKTALCVVGLTEDSSSLFGYYKDSEFRTDLIQTVGVIVYQGKQLQFCISDSGLPAVELNEYGVPTISVYDVSNRWLQFITQEYVDIDSADSIARTLISNYYKHRVRSDDLAIGREMKVLEDYQPASNKSYCKQNTVWNPTVPFVSLAEGQQMSLESSYFLNKSSHHLESLIYKKSPEGKWVSPEVNYVVRKKLSDDTLADSLVTNRDEGVYSYSKQRSHGKLARSFKIIPSIGAPSEKITFSDLLNDQNNSYTFNRDTVVEYLQDDVEDPTPKTDDNKVVYWSSEDLPGTRYVIADFSDLNYEELGISFAGKERHAYHQVKIFDPDSKVLGQSQYGDSRRILSPNNGYSSDTYKEDSVIVDQFTVKRSFSATDVDSSNQLTVSENSIFTVMITSSDIEIPIGTKLMVKDIDDDKQAIIEEISDFLGAKVVDVTLTRARIRAEKCTSNLQGSLVRRKEDLTGPYPWFYVVSDSETSKKFKWKAPLTYHDLSENKRFFTVTYLQSASWKVTLSSPSVVDTDEDQNN